MILVTAAGGTTGLAVTAALTARGLPVRALVGSDRARPALEARGADVVRGDVRGDVTAALAGVAAVYAVWPNVDEAEATGAPRLFRAAAAAGVRRLVYHSVLRPGLRVMPHHAGKAAALPVGDVRLVPGARLRRQPPGRHRPARPAAPELRRPPGRRPRHGGGPGPALTAAGAPIVQRMCRNIRPLSNFEPPATDDEVSAAALQYVRKISGTTRPSQVNEAAFSRAVSEVAEASARLLDALVTTAPPKDREVEAAKARARAAARYGTPGRAAG